MEVFHHWLGKEQDDVGPLEPCRASGLHLDWHYTDLSAAAPQD